MHIGEAGDPLTAYIALTRVQDRHGLFVYRPFPAAPFQRGAKVGRELLLRFWGGERLDWSALRAKYRDERECKECSEAKPMSAFTAGRRKRADAGRVCKECIRRRWSAAALAMHGMHGVETGRCLHGKTCKATSHILPYLHDVRTDTSVQCLQNAQGWKEIFGRDVETGTPWWQSVLGLFE